MVLVARKTQRELHSFVECRSHLLRDCLPHLRCPFFNIRSEYFAQVVPRRLRPFGVSFDDFSKPMPMGELMPQQCSDLARFLDCALFQFRDWKVSLRNFASDMLHPRGKVVIQPSWLRTQFFHGDQPIDDSEQPFGGFCWFGVAHLTERVCKCQDACAKSNVIFLAIATLCSLRKCPYVMATRIPPSLCPSQPAITLKSHPASIAFEQKKWRIA